MAQFNFRPLTRDQLSKICGGNQEAIRAFEKLFQQAGQLTPDEIVIIFGLIQEVTVDAATALTAANEAMTSLQLLIARLGLEPIAQPAEEPDDLNPPVQIGTLAYQNADAVEVGALTASGVVTADTYVVTGAAVANGTDPVTVSNLAPTGMTDTVGAWLPLEVNGQLYLAPLFEYAP